MAEIGTKIKYLRETVHNLDQIELARLAKISNATVSDVEAGKVMPTQKTLEKIANVFGMDMIEMYQCNIEDLSKTNIVEISEEDMEIKRWAKDPSNFDYIKYIYNIHKKGIAKELLNKLEFKLKV